VLYYSQDPPPSGYCLNLANVERALAPRRFHFDTPEEYREQLRAAYRSDPRPFIALAREAVAKQLTLCSIDRPDLVVVLWQAIVGVAAARNIGRGALGIAGGLVGPPIDVEKARRRALYANSADAP
jgi:hypothetical protein